MSNRIKKGLNRLAREYQCQPQNQIELSSDFPYVYSIWNERLGWVDVLELADCTRRRAPMPPVYTPVMQWAVECFIGPIDRLESMRYATSELKLEDAMSYDDLTKRLDEIVITLKHGKHDQSSHGRKRGGGGGGKSGGGRSASSQSMPKLEEPKSTPATVVKPVEKPRKIATPEELERRALVREANKVRLSDNPVEAMYAIRDVDKVIELTQMYRKMGDNKMAEIALNAFRDNFFDGDIDEADDYISDL